MEGTHTSAGAESPLERAPADLADGRDLWLKREDVHELGAFKWRGALPVVERFAAEGRSAVVTASTGNHGAAVAWAGRRCGLPVRVFVPAGASAEKLDLLERLGAELTVAGRDLDEAKDTARATAAQEGLPFFEDGAEPLQYDAYGRIADELLDRCPTRPRAVVIPVGNGALAGGMGSVLGRRAAGTLRIGVVAKAMPVMAACFEAGEVAPAHRSETIADGLAVRVPIPLAVARLRESVDRMLRVSERAIATALVVCADRGLRVEPAAAAAFAALAQLEQDGPIAVVVTGRNVDEALLERARHDLASFPA
jgi:threonine dehydratase